MKSGVYISAAVFCLICFSTALQAENIKIGVSLPLTGEASAYGDDARKAIGFAAKRYGVEGIEFIFEDDQCSGKGAVTVAHKFSSLDGVKAVLGPICSGALLAAAPVYNQSGIYTFGIATSAPAVSDAGEFIFRISPNDISAARILADHVLKANFNKIGVFSEETEYCEAFRAEFTRNATIHGGQVSAGSFNTGDTDFRTALLALKNQQVSAVFVNTQSEKTFVLVMRQIAQLGWNPKVFGAYWPSSKTLIANLGKHAEGIEFVDLPEVSDFLSADGQHVYADFVALNGLPQSNPVVGPLAIEAVHLLTELRKSGSWKERLASGTFNGLWGSYRFDTLGDVTGIPLVLKKIASGKVVTIARF